MNCNENVKAEKVLIISQYSLPAFKKNMNAYQRIYYGSGLAKVTVLIRRKQIVSDELKDCAKIHRAPFENRWLYLIYSILYSGWLRLKGLDAFLTEPTGMAAAGYFSKILFGTYWVLDMWDRPQWRPGKHQKSRDTSLFDRIVFWIMGHADFYILSCLPEAVIDIGPIDGRYAQFPNALDISLKASEIPHRDENGGNLRLVFGKSIFDDTIGLSVIVKAAEILSNRGCRYEVHLVGEMGDVARNFVKSSSSSEKIIIHGFINKDRLELFKKMHVGLIPYMNYEDLRFIFPIKVLEHLSQGNAVIASNLPGLSKMIVEGENGILVAPNDSVQMADAVERLADDHELWNKLAKGALKSFEKFDARKKNFELFQAIFKRKKLLRNGQLQ